MPWQNGRWVAPRKPIAKQQNGPLVAVWLAFRLLTAELAASGGDWDKVISTFRGLLGEPATQRIDFHEDGTRVRYSHMAEFVNSKRDEWGAK
jgi:hypothetical protein